MSKELDELMFTLRQHPAFREFMDAVDVPGVKHYQQGKDPQAQYADFIFRSGRRLQHDIWRQFLIGEPTSQQEKS